MWGGRVCSVVGKGLTLTTRLEIEGGTKEKLEALESADHAPEGPQNPCGKIITTNGTHYSHS